MSTPVRNAAGCFGDGCGGYSPVQGAWGAKSEFVEAWPSHCGAGVLALPARVHDLTMVGTGDSEFVEVGPREYLERLMDEYGLPAATVSDLVRTREALVGSALDRGPGRTETRYLVHVSLLRSYGEFACAGDNEALAFCREVAEEMVRAYGISEDEAVARINRQWSDPGEDGVTPRIWIVGLDIVYHETAEFWAGLIYYGGEGRWWDPTANVRPLPPPR